MKTLKILALCMSLAMTAGSTETNQPTAGFVLKAIASPESPDTFAEELGHAYRIRVVDTSVDRLRPINIINWEIRYAWHPLEERDALPGEMKGAVWKSFTYTLRKAVLDTPLFEWTKDKPTFLARTVRDSVNGVEEEELSLMDPNAKFRSVSTAWWKELDEDARPLRYGIRPFRTSPYAYASYAFRNHAGENLALANVRYHYRNFNDHELELTASVPIDRHTSFDAGAVHEFGAGMGNMQPTFQLRREFKRGEGFITFSPGTLAVFMGFNTRF
jgi:hypothetical protein